MAHNTITIVLLRRLQIAAIIAANAFAGISAATADAADRPAAGPANSLRGTETVVAGAAGTGVVPAVSARAAGVAVAGLPRLAAYPTVSTTTGTRLATEPRVRTAGPVTASGVAVSAAVLGGHTGAHATVARTTYGRHDLGRIAVHCRDGRPTAERIGVVRLTANTIVHYGQIHGTRVVGATVLVLGPADRAIRVITIASVSCSSADTPPASSGKNSSRACPPPRTADERPSTTAPSSASAVAGTDTPRPSDTDAAGKRRWVPRAPASPMLPATCR